MSTGRQVGPCLDAELPFLRGEVDLDGQHVLDNVQRELDTEAEERGANANFDVATHGAVEDGGLHEDRQT